MDAAALLRLALVGCAVALVPLAWLQLRRHGGDARAWLAALTALTLFLTFDLVVFGAYTRLSDSGLGCPDWPGCYGAATPLGAAADIRAAQQAAPAGPVTWHKAWVEMVHRYLAMAVGVLSIVIAAASVALRRRLPHSPLLPWATLAWVVVQGLFGRYTVTWKLYPAVVTLHLLGGLVLLGLLALQHAGFRGRAPVPAPPLRTLAAAAFVALGVQVALGGWVSTNYAVLACGTDFPACTGAADWRAGFTLLRELGRHADGTPLGVDALMAIHLAHRMFAIVAAALLALLAWRLVRVPALRGSGRAIGVLLAAQLATGLTNVVLGWPLAAALLHTAGAAALVVVLTALLARPVAARRPARRPVAAAA